MNTMPVLLKSWETPISGPQVTFSLTLFRRFLQEKTATSLGITKVYLETILAKIQSIPEQQSNGFQNDFSSYAEIFELIFLSLEPLTTQEHEVAWGITLPFDHQVIGGTNTLYDLLVATHKEEITGHSTVESAILEQTVFLYTAVIEKLYNYKISSLSTIVREARNSVSGLSRYYSVEMDHRFAEIEFEGALPPIDMEAFESNDRDEHSVYQDLKIISALLPLEKIKFNGFSIITLQDITQKKVIENIKDVILSFSGHDKTSRDETVYQEIAMAVKELLGDSLLHVNLLPVLKINNQLVSGEFGILSSELTSISETFGLPVDSYLEGLNAYIKNPQIVFKKDLSSFPDIDDPFLISLKNAGIKSFAIFPLFAQRKLVGILMVSTKYEKLLNENTISSIIPALPFIEQFLQTNEDDFRLHIEDIIKKNFTSIQPSVQWKFNEVAFQFYLSQQKNKPADIGAVSFENVYPLYGAIDIRNSTLERNKALQADMLEQLNALKDLLDSLNTNHETPDLMSIVIYKTTSWILLIQEVAEADDEIELDAFFAETIRPFLVQCRNVYPTFKNNITNFLKALESGNTHRNALEESFKLIIRSINEVLDLLNPMTPSAYPYYFEKYRSDGIEYDIYIGQSLTPEKPYHPLYLEHLKLLQLKCMVQVTQATRRLHAQLPTYLETTQLIFIHSNTITISFRSDEHRFDVEGAYNIRYEMIKKRIDKVKIRNTEERLTQPGKIALVYAHNKDAEVYLLHIKHLQKEGELEKEIEVLELEELQGVSNLKALRITVIV